MLLLQDMLPKMLPKRKGHVAPNNQIPDDSTSLLATEELIKKQPLLKSTNISLTTSLFHPPSNCKQLCLFNLLFEHTLYLGK